MARSASELPGYRRGTLRLPLSFHRSRCLPSRLARELRSQPRLARAPLLDVGWSRESAAGEGGFWWS